MSATFVLAAIFGGLAAPLLLTQLKPVVRPLLATSPETSLPFSPNELSIRDVMYVMVMLVIKSLAQSIGVWPCQSVAKNADGAMTISGPRLSISMPFEVKPDDPQKFARAVGKEKIDLAASAGLAMLFLSSMTEPTMLLLLGKKASPIKPLGAVNVCNRFDILDPKACLALIAMRLPDAVVVSSLSKNVRAVKRGYEFDLLVEILAGTEAKPVFRQTFTMLQFAKHKLEILPKVEEQASKQALTAGPEFSMTTQDPLRWAAICKDYNPIHISTLGAKIFGMTTRIAHGNHVVAKALATLPPAMKSGASAKSSKEFGKPSWLSVSFKRPTALPTILEVHSSSDRSGESEFKVYKNGRVCVDGKFRLA